MIFYLTIFNKLNVLCYKYHEKLFVKLDMVGEYFGLGSK